MSFPRSEFIESWRMDEVISPIETICSCDNATVHIEEHRETILIRTLNLKKKKDETARDQFSRLPLSLITNRPQRIETPIDKMTTSQLKEMLQTYGLDQSGKRSVLLQRLKECLSKQDN